MSVLAGLQAPLAPSFGTLTLSPALLEGYPGSRTYVLGHINSIHFRNVTHINSEDGRIYNLLARQVDRRLVKCGCSKSSCESNYCECFRKGQGCGDKCSCLNCKNTLDKKSEKYQRKPSRRLHGGCNCQRSACLKNYCQCYQNGDRCGPQCKCNDCGNKDKEKRFPL